MPAGIYKHKKLDPAYLRRRAEAKFWKRIKKKANGCWDWLGARLGPTADYPRLLPYGLVTFEGRLQRAHRVAYELAIGEIPVGMLVLHHCDNPPCVNPAHLYLGDYQNNMDDRRERGRNIVRPAIKKKIAQAMKQRFVDDPRLAQQIKRRCKRQWAAGVGVGSKEAHVARLAGLRRYWKEYYAAKAEKG